MTGMIKAVFSGGPENGEHIILPDDQDFYVAYVFNEAMDDLGKPVGYDVARYKRTECLDAELCVIFELESVQHVGTPFPFDKGDDL